MINPLCPQLDVSVEPHPTRRATSWAATRARTRTHARTHSYTQTRTEKRSKLKHSYHLRFQFPDLLIQTLLPRLLAGVKRGALLGVDPAVGRLLPHPPEQTLGGLPADFYLYVFEIRDAVAASAFVHRAEKPESEREMRDFTSNLRPWRSGENAARVASHRTVWHPMRLRLSWTAPPRKGKTNNKHNAMLFWMLHLVVLSHQVSGVVKPAPL